MERLFSIEQKDRTFPTLYLLEPATYGVLYLGDCSQRHRSVRALCSVSALVTEPVDQLIKVFAAPFFATAEHFIYMGSLLRGEKKNVLAFSARLITTPIWLPVKIVGKVLIRGSGSLICIIRDLFFLVFRLPSRIQRSDERILEFFEERNNQIQEMRRTQSPFWNLLPEHKPRTRPSVKPW